jgi:hypothetical protein
MSVGFRSLLHCDGEMESKAWLRRHQLRPLGLNCN